MDRREEQTLRGVIRVVHDRDRKRDTVNPGLLVSMKRQRPEEVERSLASAEADLTAPPVGIRSTVVRIARTRASFVGDEIRTLPSEDVMKVVGI